MKPIFGTKTKSKEAGSVAVEFYYVAIVLFVLALGMVEASNMLSHYRKVSLASQVMVDIVARSTDPQNADVNELSNAVAITILPFKSSFKATVAVVPFDADGDVDLSADYQLYVADVDPFTDTELAQEADSLGLGRDDVLIGRVVARYEPLLILPFFTGGFDVEVVNSQRPRPST